MDFNRVEALLKKYWEAETSQEEEQQLRSWFRENEAPEALKEAAAMFRYFDDAKEKSLPDTSFESLVLGSLPPSKQGRVRKLVYNTLRIAAGVVVLVAATWFVHTEIRKSTPPEVVDTYDDPKLAFEETKKALLMISKSFGTAEKQARKINMFNEAQEEIQKSKEEDGQKL